MADAAKVVADSKMCDAAVTEAIKYSRHTLGVTGVPYFGIIYLYLI